MDISTFDEHTTHGPSNHITEGNQLDIFEIVSDDWSDRRSSDLGFTAKSLLMCCLPVTQPKKDERGNHETNYEVINGPIKLKILADKNYGIPFGSDRLLTYWFITYAVRNQTKEIKFDTPNVILSDLGMARNGQNYEWLAGALLRMSTSSQIIYPISTKTGEIKAVHHNIFRAFNVYCNPDYVSEEGNYVLLSDDFFQDLVRHKKSVPIDMRVLRLLKKSPTSVDLYALLSWRAFTVLEGDKDILRIPLKGLKQQLGQGGKVLSKFKFELKGWLKKINKAFKDAYGDIGNLPVKIEGDNLLVAGAKLIPNDNSKLFLDTSLSDQINNYLNSLPTSSAKNSELDYIMSLTRDNYTQEQIHLSIQYILKYGDFHGRSVKRIAKYLDKGAIRDVLRKIDGNITPTRINKELIFESAKRYNTYDGGVPPELKEKLTSDDLKWVEAKGGFLQLSQNSNLLNMLEKVH